MNREQIEKGMSRLALMGRPTDYNKSCSKIKIKTIEINNLCATVLENLIDEYDRVVKVTVCKNQPLLINAMRRARRLEIDSEKAKQYTKIRLTDYNFLVGLAEC